MSNLSVIERNGTLVVDSRLIAQDLGIQHKNLMDTLEKYQDKIEAAFGAIAFETREFKTKQGNRSTERIAYLTEEQANVGMTFSRNTDRVVQCKIDLVKAFSKAKLKATELHSAAFPVPPIDRPQEQPAIESEPVTLDFKSDLDTLIDETNQLYGEFERAVVEPTPALRIAKEIGDRLLQMKAHVGHGLWESFREQNIKSPNTGQPMPSSTASLYQRIARHWDTLEQLNAQTIRDADLLLRRDRTGKSGGYSSGQVSSARTQLQLFREGLDLLDRLGGISPLQESCLKIQIVDLLLGG